MDIVEFLTAREDERERIALVALSCTEDGTCDAARWFVADQQVVGDDGSEDGMTVAHARWDDPGILDHVAANDPAWVLTDVAAKRTIIAEHAPGSDRCDEHDASFRTVPCPTILALASIFAGHPNFDPSWRVEEAQFAHVITDLRVHSAGPVADPPHQSWRVEVVDEPST